MSTSTLLMLMFCVAFSAVKSSKQTCQEPLRLTVNASIILFNCLPLIRLVGSLECIPSETSEDHCNGFTFTGHVLFSMKLAIYYNCVNVG